MRISKIDIVIEKNVPIEAVPIRKLVDIVAEDLSKMEVGDSFVQDDGLVYTKIMEASTLLRKTTNKNFHMKTTKLPDRKRRYWRIS